MGLRRATGRLARPLLVLLLGGCAALPQPEILPPPDGPPAAYRTPDGPGTLYPIRQAKLILHTYRAGWLAGLTHNHVMETDALRGAVLLGEPSARSRAVLYFRPWDLLLDRPEARAAAGEGFESARSAGDIAATRTRMLGPRGFHANRHPFVVVEVRWVDEDHAALAIRFRDTVHEARVPVRWRLQGNRLEVAADFELRHEDLGIRPYSAFAGALAVAEPIRVQLTLWAEAGDGVN